MKEELEKVLDGVRKEVKAVSDFKVTKDRRIFLDDTEIKRVLGYSINADAGSDPEVVLRVAVDSIDIDEYTDVFGKRKEATP